MAGQVQRAMGTAAQRQQDSSKRVVNLLESMKTELQRAAPKGMSADRVVRLMTTEIRKNPLLAQCDDASFLGALLTSTALGLEPGVGGEAWLVPYKNSKTGRYECQLIVGYQGYVKLFYQHPLAQRCNAEAVYEGDEFDYSYGTNKFLMHRPKLGADAGRKVIAYYATWSTTSGHFDFTVMSPAEVRALRGKEGPNGGIADPQHWMERKTVLKQALKLAPRSTVLVQALQVDERMGGDLRREQLLEQGRAQIDPPPRAIDTGVDFTTGEMTEPEPQPEDGIPTEDPPMPPMRADGEF